MGALKGRLRAANPSDQSRSQEIEFLVDTGASYSWISRERLNAIGVKPSASMQFRTIEGNIEREMAPIFVSINGRVGGDTVVVGEPGDMEVIGAMTLETLGLAADPVQKKLVPTIGLALAAKVRSVIRNCFG